MASTVTASSSPAAYTIEPSMCWYLVSQLLSRLFVHCGCQRTGALPPENQAIVNGLIGGNRLLTGDGPTIDRVWGWETKKPIGRNEQHERCMVHRFVCEGYGLRAGMCTGYEGEKEKNQSWCTACWAMDTTVRLRVILHEMGARLFVNRSAVIMITAKRVSVRIRFF